MNVRVDNASVTGADVLSDIVIFAKYARYKPEEMRRETWDEICDRYENMLTRRFPSEKNSIREAVRAVRQKKILPSMRALQFAGKAAEEKNARMYNCCLTKIDSVIALKELFYMLMCGSGVGYSVQKHHVKDFPRVHPAVRENVTRFVVPDTTEGWCESLYALVCAFVQRTPVPEFDYSVIRPKGAPLVTTGGVAPGPEPLRKLHVAVTRILEDIANNCTGVVRPIHAHSICCHIADAVHVGGVRRAALISFFDHDDDEMLTCKSGEWWLFNPHFGRANNSVVLHRATTDKDMYKRVFSFIRENNTGEPGIFWTNSLEMLSNPCFGGDTRILTEHGYERISDVVGDVRLVNKDGQVVPGRVWCSGTKETVTVRAGSVEIVCTHTHEFMLADGTSCFAQDLCGKTLMSYHNSGRPPVVESVTPNTAVEVFDFSLLEGDNHWGVVEGVIAHNCVEAGLYPHQMCNLSSVNVVGARDHHELKLYAQLAARLGTYQASFTDFSFLRASWEETTRRDALIGVSLTGVAARNFSPANYASAAHIAVLANMGTAIRIGVNPAARATLLKPEGTGSLVLKTPSGIHAWESPYYFRTLRVEKNEPAHDYLKAVLGDLVEDCVEKPDIMSVVRIPVAATGGLVKKDESALNLMERVSTLHKHWVLPGHRSGDNTHSVSCTVSVREHEWDGVEAWMWNHRDEYAGLATFPYWGGTHRQLPFVPCTKEEYDWGMSLLRAVDMREVREYVDTTAHKLEAACAGGVCEVL